MVDDDKRTAPTAADDLETAERASVFPQRSQISGRLAVLVASHRDPDHIFSTLLGHYHVQHVVGNVTKTQHEVSMLVCDLLLSWT